MPTRHRPSGGDRTRPSPYRSPRPRPVSPSARTPLLLRITLAAAVVFAVAASLVRTHSNSIAADRAVPAGDRAAASQLAASQLAASQVTASSAKSSGRRPAASCRVLVAVTSRTADRYTAVLTVVNTGSAPVHGWTLRWRAARGEQLTNGWNATVTNDAGGARAIDAGLNRDLPPGGSTTIGFVAMSDSVGAASPAGTPNTFSLNGVRCR